MSEYFRYIVNVRVDFVELTKEMHHIENYLNIQKERYQKKLDFFIEWETQVEQCLIPPLVIQSFLENSMKYGFKDDNTLFVFVLARQEDDHVLIMIADTGKGFDKQILGEIQDYLDTRVYRDTLGVGIQNTVERMDMIYGERVDVRINNAEFGGSMVEIRLPMDVV